VACHTPSLKKVKKQEEIPLPSLSPIPSPKFHISKWDGTEAGYGISLR